MPMARRRTPRGVQAHAYTVGRDIVFGAGQYRPETDAGRRLRESVRTAIQRQEEEVERQRRNDATALPSDLDYARLAGLSHEVRQQLARIRPATIGQAGRVPGVTPAAISILLVYLKKRSLAGRSRVA